jgi:hypothetical protein
MISDLSHEPRPAAAHATDPTHLPISVEVHLPSLGHHCQGVVAEFAHEPRPSMLAPPPVHARDLTYLPLMALVFALSWGFVHLPPAFPAVLHARHVVAVFGRLESLAFAHASLAAQAPSLGPPYRS